MWLTIMSSGKDKYLHSEEDLEQQHESWTEAPRNLEDMLKILDLVPDDIETVLDYGCGSGRYSHHFNNYRGYDHNPAWIPFARKKYPGKKFVLKLGSEKFDLILCVSVIQYQPDRELKSFVEDLMSRAKKYALIQTWDNADNPSMEVGGFKGVIVHKRNKNIYLDLLSKYGKVERHVIGSGEMAVYLVEVKK